MPLITFIEHDGSKHVVRADVGQSLMQAAVAHPVPGIPADCGGSCSCATCHAYIDETGLDRMPPPAPDELDMLGCAIDVRDNSRLTCQVAVTPELDGLVVRLPASQT